MLPQFKKKENGVRIYSLINELSIHAHMHYYLSKIKAAKNQEPSNFQFYFKDF